MKRYILRHKLLFLITVILSVFSGLISLYLAYIMEVVSDIVFNLNTTRIMECVLLIVVFFIYSCVISYLFTNIKSHSADFGPFTLWIKNYPYAAFKLYDGSAIPKRYTRKLLMDRLVESQIKKGFKS